MTTDQDIVLIRCALTGVLAEDGEHDSVSRCPYCVGRITRALEALDRIESTNPKR